MLLHVGGEGFLQNPSFDIVEDCITLIICFVVKAEQALVFKICPLLLAGIILLSDGHPTFVCRHVRVEQAWILPDLHFHVQAVLGLIIVCPTVVIPSTPNFNTFTRRTPVLVNSDAFA